MRKIILFAFWAAAVTALPAAGDFSEDLTAFNLTLEKSWKKHDIVPAPVIGDAAFLRRLSLRTRGKLPDAEDLKHFIGNKDPHKRRKLIDAFLNTPDFADMMAMRYADMFRIKSEFPINLWPNAVQCYHRYFYLVTLNDRSWRTVAEELLVSSGSNFRIPAANFFRANADRSPKGLAAGTALALMNLRTEKMPEDLRRSFENFFTKIRFKSTKEWKEEIVYSDFTPARIECRTPDGKNFSIDTAERDPRQVLAAWLCDEANPLLARAYVNRAWYWMTGTGIANPVDDMALPRNFWERVFGDPRPNDPCDGEIMDFLTRFFIKNGYSTKALYRLILNSRAWQADWRCPPGKLPLYEKHLAVYPVRRLESEIINDVLGKLTGGYESFVSVIPEPFTFIPYGSSAVSLADGSMSTGTLDKFGRSPRDSGKIAERNNNFTGAQRLYLMNSGVLFSRITQLPNRVFRNRRLNWDQQLDLAWLTLLSRYPTAAERRAARRYLKQLDQRKKWRFWQDLFWALVNTAEFSCHR